MVNEYQAPTFDVELMNVEGGYALSPGFGNEDMGDLEEL